MRKQLITRHYLSACVLAGSALLVGALHADQPAPSGSYVSTGITNPSEQRGLNFNVPGVVAKVMVKEGDIVKKGDVVAQEDDSVEVAELGAAALEAEGSKIRIEASEADLNLKRVLLTRAEKGRAKNVVGEEDLEKAQLDVIIGEKTVTLAKTEAQQKEAAVGVQKAKIGQKKLLSTIDGIVKKINVHEGELATNDPKTPCMMIVSNDPLYVEVDLPVSVAAGLQLKTPLDVRYLGLPNDTKWHQAQIIFFDPTSNAGAGTQRVRLQLDNPSHLRSGVQMEVSPSDPKHEKAVADAAPAR